jgi:hypothetical protein
MRDYAVHKQSDKTGSMGVFAVRRVHKLVHPIQDICHLNNPQFIGNESRVFKAGMLQVVWIT